MIHGKITLKLTRTQTKELRKFWVDTTQDKGPCFCIGQAAIRMGPFWVEPAQVELIACDADAGAAIQAGIDKANGGAK